MINMGQPCLLSDSNLQFTVVFWLLIVKKTPPSNISGGQDRKDDQRKCAVKLFLQNQREAVTLVLWCFIEWVSLECIAVDTGNSQWPCEKVAHQGGTEKKVDDEFLGADRAQNKPHVRFPNGRKNVSNSEQRQVALYGVCPRTVSGLTKLSYHMPELILCNSARLWQLCQVFMEVVRFDSAG